MSFPLVPLGEVLDLDLDPVDVQPEVEYQISGVYSFGRGLMSRPPIRGADTSYKQLNRLHTGQLVLSRLKAFEGAVAITPDSYDGWFLSPEFPTFTCRPDMLDPQYLALLCQWPSFWTSLRATSKGVGARRERVHPQQLLTTRVPLPAIEEQARIAAKLGAVSRLTFDAIELSSRSQTLMTALRSSLVSALEGERVPLREVLHQVRRDTSVQASEQYRQLGVRWYGHGLFVRETQLGTEIAANQLYRIETGDFVYNRLFAWKGSFALATDEFAGCYVSGEFPTFVVDHERLDARYLLGLFQSPDMWANAGDRSAGGTPTSRNRLKEGAFLDLRIPLPTLADQARTADLIATLSKALEPSKQRGERLAAVVPATLNEVFAGSTP